MLGVLVLQVLIDLSIFNLHLDGDVLNVIYKEQPEFLLNATAKEMLYGRHGTFVRIL
ncbi:hypothetical protein Hanom_Chr04g00370001 [Helianthus anomalus]